MKQLFPTFRRLVDPESLRWAPPGGLFRTWGLRRTTLAQRQSLLRLLAVATEENLPLGPLIEAWAADERGVQVRRLERLADRLGAGESLADAVEATPGVLSEQETLAIRFGAESGTLPASLRNALQESTGASTGLSRVFRQSAVYGWTVLLLMSCIVAFLQVKIIPSLVQIFADFELTPPSALGWSIALSDWMFQYWWLVVLVVAALLWATYSEGPGRRLRRTVLAKFSRPFMRLQATNVLDQLAVASRAGRPLPGSLSTLARYHYDPTLRGKLLYVRNEVEQGADVWRSMSDAGLLTVPEAELMHTTQRLGNRSWTLEQIADSKRRRAVRRLERLSEVLLPMIIVVLGVLVLVHALGVFAPLITLTESLC